MNYSINTLKKFAVRILTAYGASNLSADIVSERLIHADQCGHLSHGLIRLIHYYENFCEGILDPNAHPVTVINNGSFLKVDAKRSFGQVAAKYLTEKMFKEYSKVGFSVGCLINSNHIGRIVEYGQFYTSGNIASLSFANGGGPGVCPFGSTTRKLGTNPMSLFLRIGDKKISIDVASAAIAEGKLNVAKINDRKIKKNLIITKDGLNTDDPNEFYNGGSIQTAGGSKGYAFSIIIELLAGIITGNGSSAFSNHLDGNGFMQILFDPTNFTDKKNIETLINDFSEEIKTTESIDSENKVMLPGDPEEKNYLKNIHEIDIPAPNIENLNQLARTLGVQEI